MVLGSGFRADTGDRSERSKVRWIGTGVGFTMNR